MSDSPRTLHLTQFRGAAVLLMASVMASSVLGFARESYIAWAFGAGRSTDAFLTAFTVPNILSYMLAGGALSITFIPIFGSLLEKNDEAEGYRVLSIIATWMGVALIIGTALCWWFASTILRYYAPGFTPEQLELCTSMTRILLPNAFCFALGGLFAGTLYTRGSFLIPALTPLIYSLSTILGGVLLGHWLGISGMAVGATAGAFLGPFLLPLIGASRLGLRYRPSLDLSNPHFRQWLNLTIPLMLGVSMVTADDWFIRHFAASAVGAISYLNYAKRLTQVPIAVLGQAIGQAALPFFSRLVNQGNWSAFRETVDRSVVRSVTAGVFAVSFLEAITLPAVRLVFERGRFGAQDAQITAGYFAIFLLTLIFWIAQGIYARAFYATGNTFAPMLQASIVTVISLPVYWAAMRWFGIVGLAWASNAAIVLQTVTLAWLLHRRGLLALDHARWLELGRSILAAVVAWSIAWFVVGRFEPAQYHWLQETELLALVSVVWLLAVWILTYVLKLDEIRDEFSRGLRRLRGQKNLSA